MHHFLCDLWVFVCQGRIYTYIHIYLLPSSWNPACPLPYTHYTTFEVLKHLELQGEKNNQPIIWSLLEEEELSNEPLLLNRIGYHFFFVNNQIPWWYPVNSVQTLGQNARNTKQQQTHTSSKWAVYNNLLKQPTLQQPTKPTYHKQPTSLLIGPETLLHKSLRLFVSSRWAPFSFIPCNGIKCQIL